jgi:hypothetical protein
MIQATGLKTKESGFDSQQGARDNFLIFTVQTDPGAHPSSYPTGAGDFMGKATGT